MTSDSRRPPVHYWVARGATWVFTKLMFRWRIRGRRNYPRSGAVVLAPTHRSYVDIMITGADYPRRQVSFMAKKELFGNRFFGRALSDWGAFPVDREGLARAALTEALRRLEAGKVVGVFPEGTRRFGDEITDLQAGAVYLALKTGAPIVPVALAGTGEAWPKGAKFMHPVKVRGIVGPPMSLAPPAGKIPKAAEVEAGNARLQAALTSLMQEARAWRDGRSLGRGDTA